MSAIKYYISINKNNIIICKFKVNYKRDEAVQISEDKFNSIPDIIYHECGESLYEWDGDKHIARTDSALQNKIDQYEIEEVARAVRAENETKLRTEIREIAKQSLIDKGELTVEEAAEL